MSALIETPSGCWTRVLPLQSGITHGHHNVSNGDLLRMPKDGYKCELVDGEIRMSPAGFRHRSARAQVEVGPSWTLYLKVTPQKWLDPARLSALSFPHGVDQYGYFGGLSVGHPYQESEPWWTLAAVKLGAAAGGWKEVANFAAESIVAKCKEAAAPKP